MAKSEESSVNRGERESREDVCFVVMPISDPDDYPPGHFARVYEDIFRPACEASGYIPVRADHVRETNLIHLDVLQKLLESPMVLVDLSSRNPNVLFELGLRQAFDRPVAIVQERGTPKIFDIAPLRYTEYRRDRIYDQVLEDQEAIANALRATREAYSRGGGVNSIVRMLSITRPASIPEDTGGRIDPLLQMIRAEISDLRAEIRAQSSARGLAKGRPGTLRRIPYETLVVEDREGLLPSIKRFVLDERFSGLAKEAGVLDPACGSGSLLNIMSEELHEDDGMAVEARG